MRTASGFPVTAKSITLLSAFLVTVTLASASFAETQHERDLSLSVFGGRALIDPPDIGVKQPTPFIDGTAHGADLDEDFTFGAKLTSWERNFGLFTRLDFGIELDFTRFTAEMPAQTVSASGTSSGGTLGAIIFPMSFDIQSHVLAVNLLWRYPVRESEVYPSGRWYPYFGIGGGASLSRMRQSGGPWRYDSSPMFQGLAGIKFFLTRSLGIFAEYKRTQATHDFSFTGFDLEVPLGANHFVGGLAMHF